MDIIFETERLKLRPISLQDADFVRRLVNSEGWLEFIGDREVNSNEDAEAYIQKIIDKEGYHYSVFSDQKSGVPMGVVTFLHRDEENFPDIGFALLPSFEGKGYAYEASRAYLDRVLELEKFDRILGICLAHNQRSIALLKRLGLRHLEDRTKESERLSYFALKGLLKFMDVKIHPNIIQLKEKTLIGVSVEMSVQENKTAQLWGKFGPQIRQIEGRIGGDKYSLQVYPDDYFQAYSPAKPFVKWALVEVEKGAACPQGMEVFSLSGGLYAVFDYKGSSADPAIFQYIYSQWLPQSDYALDDRPHFEVLGDKYKNLDPESEEEIWIPIKHKT